MAMTFLLMPPTPRGAGLQHRAALFNANRTTDNKALQRLPLLVLYISWRRKSTRNAGIVSQVLQKMRRCLAFRTHARQMMVLDSDLRLRYNGVHANSMGLARFEASWAPFQPGQTEKNHE
jgi:trans-2-enoyl-CoA reductase